MTTAYILGAGFSKVAGLPLQEDISSKLLKKETHSSIDLNFNIEKFMIEAISEHLSKIYNYTLRSKYMPSMEDIFTNIDISANRGIFLGPFYSPEKLRALRRILIYRVFQILDEEWTRSECIINFLKNLDKESRNFVSLNWDIALEKHFLLADNSYPDYGIEEFPYGEVDIGNRSRYRIAKMHGSSNWVCCQNCKKTYISVDEKVALSLYAGLRESDIIKVLNRSKNHELNLSDNFSDRRRRCPKCGCTLEPGIATFSFQKSFYTGALGRSYDYADKILSEADHWIFIGYSLPAADFIFKHLLKSAQLKIIENHKKIDVVLYNDQDSAKKYRSLFGSQIRVYQRGFENYIKMANRRCS